MKNQCTAPNLGIWSYILPVTSTTLEMRYPVYLWGLWKLRMMLNI